MRREKKSLATLTLPLLMAASITAQAAPGDAEPPLTLDSCVRAALQESPYYRAAVEGTISASEAAESARAPYYPDLAFQMSWQRFQTHIFLPNSLDIPLIPPIVGPIDANGASVSASYTLFDSGARKAQATAGRNTKTAAQEVAAQSREGVALSVHAAYFSLLAAQDSRDVARKDLDRAQEHLKLAEERKSVGAVPLADVLRAKVEVGRARLGLVRAEGDLSVARGNLNTAMGRSPDSPLGVASPDAPVTACDLAPPQADLQRAIEKRPDLKAAASRVEARRSDVSLARSAFGPKLLAQAKYGRLDSDFFPQDEDWAVGVTLQVPIYNYGRSHALARARSELSQKELEKRQLELSVEQEVWTARSSVRTAWESILAARTLAQDAAESLRMAKERYAAGAGTVTDLLDAETNKARADLDEVQAEYGYRLALSSLRKAKGELSE
jgi:outer membrane protein